mgnify:CR=1 FL=1
MRNLSDLPAFPRGMTSVDADVSTAFVGPPGCGKSWMKAAELRALARTPAYVISFDPAGAVRGADVRRHDSAASLAAALATEQRCVIHVLDVMDGRQVLTAAMQLGKTSRARASGLPVEKYKLGDRPATPVVIDVDEVVAFHGAGKGGRLVPLMAPQNLDPALAEAYIMRRHMLLLWCWGTQRPAFVHPSLWESVRTVVIFRLGDDDSLSALQKDASVPGEVIDRVRRLEFVPHRFAGARVEGRHFIVHRR